MICITHKATLKALKREVIHECLTEYTGRSFPSALELTDGPTLIAEAAGPINSDRLISSIIITPPSVPLLQLSLHLDLDIDLGIDIDGDNHSTRWIPQSAKRLT